MACRFTYQGKTYDQDGLVDALRKMPPEHAQKYIPGSSLPDMPFKQTEQWAGLALKRMIQKAAEEGKTRVSWTPGEAQAARYDLSKHFDELQAIPSIDEGKPTKTWWPKGKGGRTFDSITTDNDGNILKSGQVWGDIKGKNIADVIGKDVAEKGLKEGPQTLTGVDLKVGGAGMKGFYDQMLPKIVEKIGKQYGVKVKYAEGAPPFKVPDLPPGYALKESPVASMRTISGKQYWVEDPEGKYVPGSRSYRSGDHSKAIVAGVEDQWLARHAPDLKDRARDILPKKIPYFDIPPKMRDDILKKGFPLFSDSSVGAPISAEEHSSDNKINVKRPVNQAKTAPEINVPQRASGGRVVASNINHQPSEAQKRAGTYSKDHVNIFGLNLTIENAKGKERSGIGKDSKRWSVRMPAHYGYIKRTEGADGDHVDIYLGQHTKSKHVFVVNQIDADSKQFDEIKVLLGFGSLQQALHTYEQGFSDGKGLQRVGSVVATDMTSFKNWLKSGNTKKPFILPK
jgi:hypothetical protein